MSYCVLNYFKYLQTSSLYFFKHTSCNLKSNDFFPPIFLKYYHSNFFTIFLCILSKLFFLRSKKITKKNVKIYLYENDFQYDFDLELLNVWNNFQQKQFSNSASADCSCFLLTQLTNYMTNNFNHCSYKNHQHIFSLLRFNIIQYYLRNLWGYIFCNIDVKNNLNISMYPFRWCDTLLLLKG